MRKLLHATAVALFLATSASAQMLANIETLKAYAIAALPSCPDSKIEISPINQRGPAGFVVFEVKLTSSDQTCGKDTYLMYSPKSQTILLGNAFALPNDARPATIRVA